MRVGCTVFTNDYRNPVMLAKESATLDLLSDGRFELGLGAGWSKREYEQAGFAFETSATRVERLGEAVHILRSLRSNRSAGGTHQLRWAKRESADSPAVFYRTRAG